MLLERQNKDGFIGIDEARQAVGEFFAQRDYAGNLDGLEYAVVVIALYCRQVVKHIPVACCKADSKTGHIIWLAQRRKFHADVFGAFDRKKARCLIAVEARLAVRKIVNHGYPAPLGHFHHRLKKPLIDRHCSRIVGVI